MKKITLFLFLLTFSFGYSQDPAAGPTDPPARDPGDVISIYGGAPYTNEPNGDLQDFGGTTIVGPVVLGDGNTVLKYTNHLYSGIRAGAGDLNVTAMTKMHIDVYSPSGNFTSFKIKLESVSGAANEIEVPFTKVQGSWNSYDLDLSTYVGVDLTHLKWIVPVSYSPPGVTLYLDNVYFYRPAVDPLTNADLTDLKVDATTVSGFGPGTINYSVGLPGGTVIVPQITAVTTSNPSATTVITQSLAIPGSATVVVTAADAITTKTYTISFFIEGPAIKAPTAPNRTPSDVISLYSDVYTNIAPINWNPGWTPGISTVSFVQIQGDNTIKVTKGPDSFFPADAAAAPHSNLTTFEYMHMDYWTDDAAVGLVLNPKLSQWGGGAGEVAGYVYTLPISSTGGAWVSVNIPLSNFTSTSNLTDVAQVVWQSNATGLYLDNIYFYKGTALAVSKFETSKIKMYPNPVSNELNIEANSAIQKIAVYNVLGQEVLSSSPKANSAKLQTSSLQNGVYIIKTTIDDVESSSKFIKN